MLACILQNLNLHDDHYLPDAITGFEIELIDVLAYAGSDQERSTHRSKIQKLCEKDLVESSS